MVSGFDELLPTATRIVELSMKYYQQEHTLEAFAVLWPTQPFYEDGGAAVDTVLCPLENVDPMPALHAAATRTKARGLVLVQRVERTFLAVFETPHGARSWTARLEHHGDVHVLTPARTRDNANTLGVLYHRN